MGVLGAPVYLGGDIRSIYRYLSYLSTAKWEVYRFLKCSLWGVPIQNRPPASAQDGATVALAEPAGYNFANLEGWCGAHC